jgi:hypothetical protein
MQSRTGTIALVAALLVGGPCRAEGDPAAPVREVMRLAMWSIAADPRGDAVDGPFAAAALERLYTKSFAALYAAALAKVKGAEPPFDRDPILDGTAECPLKDIVLTTLSPGAFHARVKVEFRSAWCAEADAARRDRVTVTMFEVYNENEEWRVDDIRREDFAFRDVLAAAAPDAGKEPAPAAPPAEPKKCISMETDFKQRAAATTYEITLANACAEAMRCTVTAYVVTAGGPSSGKAVLMLAGKAKGAAAKKTYAMKVKGMGGSANISRECKPM